MKRAVSRCAVVALAFAAACSGAPSGLQPPTGDADAGADFDAGEISTPLDAGVRPVDCGSDTACGIVCTDLSTDPTNCGQCGRTCVIPDAVAGCAAGECAIAACPPGRFDMDGDITNGCEFEDACVPGAACPLACGIDGLTVCTDGVAACVAPQETCNLADDDCDGTCDEGPIVGCRAGVHRSHGNGHLYTTDLTEAQSAPFNLEAENYFFVYASEVPATRPLFLCPKGGGKRFLTSATDCEIGRAPERTLGYFSASPACGTVPLYRLYHEPSNNHFYTLSAAERDNAVTTYGYVTEGIVGHVWRAP